MKRLALLLCLLPSLAQAATLYLKSGGGNCSAAGTWSNVNASGVDNSGPPTVNDDAIAELLSGNVTIDATCRMLSFSTTAGTGNYGGVITHTAAVTWQIGSTLTFNTGMSYLKGNSATSAVSFLGANSTGTITSAGKVFGNVSFGGAGTVYNLFDNFVATNTTQVTTLSSGALHMDGAADNSGLSPTVGALSSSNANSRFLYMGTSSMTIIIAGGTGWNLAATGGMTFSQGTSTIAVISSGGTTFNSAGTSGSGLTYSTLILNGAGTPTMTLSGVNTFRNLKFIGTTNKTDILSVASNETVTELLSILGNSAVNRPIVQSSTYGTARILTVTGATFTVTNSDFRDITLSPAKDISAVTGNSGDCGGNSGLTLTTSASQARAGTTSFTWSTLAGWTSRVPLCQDDVVLTSNFTTGQTITFDMPRWGRSIDASGVTWTGTGPIFSAGGVANSVYGSMAFPTQSGATQVGNAGFNFLGRAGSYTFASGGLAFVTSVTFNTIGSTYTLLDAFSNGSGFTTTFTNGVFDANNFNVTSGLYSFASATTNIVRMGSGVWSATGTGTPWSVGANTGVFSGTSIIYLSNTTNNTKTFAGASKTFYDLLIASSPNTVSSTFTGNNSFHNFTVKSPRQILLTAASTQTITGNLYTDSVSGSSVTFRSTANGSKWFFDKTSAGWVCGDFISLQDSRVRPNLETWFAGDNGADNGSNQNWAFRSCYRQSSHTLVM